LRNGAAPAVAALVVPDEPVGGQAAVDSRAADLRRMISSRLKRLMADSRTPSSANVACIRRIRSSKSGHSSPGVAPSSSKVPPGRTLDGEAEAAGPEDGCGVVDEPAPEEKNSCRAAAEKLLLFYTAERPAAANLVKIAGKRSSFVHISSILATTRVSRRGLR